MSSFAQMKVNSPSRPTSSTAHGKLTQFQEKLLLRYQNYIKVLQDRAETVAKKSNDDLQNRMNQFLKKKGEILGVREQILSSMDNAEKTFDELRINLNETRESLKSEVDSLHHDALSIYESSFQSLRPDIEKSINDTKDIEPQLPDYSKGKLEHEIQCLNKKFLETKKMLISTLYQIEQSILNDCENAEDQFEEKTNMYHENNFIGLLKIVKESLNPEKPIDYSELCKQFYNDEQKFVQCLTKQIQGINIFSPPNNFSDEELDFWMKGCNNILEMHNIFLDQFKEKFKEHTQAVDNDNIALVEQLEKDALNLRPESPALSAFAEIQPLLTVSQKAHNEFYEKMIKYWSNRTEAMQKSVTSIHDFLKPLIDIYHEFVTREKEIEENVAEQTKNLSNASNEILNQLEDELSLKINEIETLIDQNEINIRVKDCKAILNKIEAEYRSFYEKANDGYVSIPAKVGDLFQSCETRVLQILKMRKTAENPDLITSSTLLPTHSSNSKENQSRPSTASSSSKKGGRRSKSKPPPEPAIPIILFNFSIKNGAKFEELEPLELIPHFDNFSENEATTPSSMTSQRSGKGKGKAPPPRPKRGQKNTKQATSNTIPEIEMPNLPLLSNVLQINGEPSITIFVPDNSIINDFVNNFRQKLLTSLHQSYSDAAVIAQHEADKFKLTDQLNERLRTHSPRANGIELNIAQQRVMSVESRKLKLSKFFTNFATSFNKSLNTLHESINERLTNITSDAEKLHHFIDDLYKVQASREFPQLHHIQQKDFEMYLTNRNEVIDNLNIEIETFKKHFEEIINRFVESYIASNKSNMKGSQLNLLENSNTTNNSTNESLNDCNDPEDSAMCAAIVAKVNEQMNLLLDGTKTQEKNAIDSTDLIVNKTKEEFESQFPHHVADVKFLEELSTLLNSAILKYNALMFKNKQMDDELKLAVENLETTRNLELDLQQKIARLIESVDKVRISFLRRATFLGCLKTTSFVSSPIVVVLDLTKIGENDPTSELTNNLMNSGKDLPRPTSRSRNRNSSPDKKRKSPVSSKKLNPKTSSKQNTKNSKFETAPTDSSNSLPDSLVSQINAIGQQLNQDIVHATNDYLNQVKSRKSQITRPELIPSNVNEISDKMKAKWNEYITESKNVIKKSTHSLMTFLIDTIQSIKLTIDLTFELYLEFSVKMNSIIEQTQRLHDEFEVKIKEYQIQREEYRDKLNPKTVDANNTNVLNQLIVDERTIYNDEKTVIENHRNTIIGFETSEMNLFISNLIVISNSYLQIFDNFMFVEDTTYKHRISNATRRTMTDMLREKTRIQQQQQMLQQQTNSNVADPFYVPGRPFKMREWGQLDSVMSSIKNIDELTANIKNNKPDDLNAMNNSQDLQLSQELLQNPPQSSSLSNQKDQPKQIQSSPSSLGIKKSRSISRKRSEKGLANIQPPSDPDKTPIQKSLETTTHRCVMIARNKVYHQYEMTLNERLKKFLCHMHKLASECESFEKHFQTCVLNMKPDANLNVEMVPSEKPPPKSSSSHRRKRK